MATFLYRLGLGSYRHRVAVVGVWLLLLVAAGLGAATLSGKTVNTFRIPGQESTTALEILGQKFGSGANGATAQVVLAAPAGQTVTSGPAAAAVARHGRPAAAAERRGQRHRPARSEGAGGLGGQAGRLQHGDVRGAAAGDHLHAAGGADRDRAGGPGRGPDRRGDRAGVGAADRGRWRGGAGRRRRRAGRAAAHVRVGGRGRDEPGDRDRRRRHRRARHHRADRVRRPAVDHADPRVDARPGCRHRLRAVHLHPVPAGADAGPGGRRRGGHGGRHRGLGRAHRRHHRGHRAGRSGGRRDPVPHRDGPGRGGHRGRRRAAGADAGAGGARVRREADAAPAAAAGARVLGRLGAHRHHPALAQPGRRGGRARRARDPGRVDAHHAGATGRGLEPRRPGPPKSCPSGSAPG